ncbi:MAG: MFS transporter [Rhizobiales bacterium 62-47]|nr:MFS transporter [Hyphomicrobiales bacterium]OJY11137.1 MAG: MFS transporter [Rhizobiales bacterium 62-47]
MHKLRDLLLGPERAVLVLSFTEILAWGILIYPPVLTAPHMAAEHGWSLAFCMAGLSVALIVSGMFSPTACGLIDRHGGNSVMSLGALAGAAGLAGIAVADQRITYLLCWLLIGVGMSTTLYDPAFTTLTRIFGASARRQITFVTFAGGFASTVGWPATHVLIEQVGWRGAYMTFAAVFVLVVAPLHAFALPRAVFKSAGGAPASAAPTTTAYLAPHGAAFLLLTAAFGLHAFILSGVTSNLLAMLGRHGIAASTVVAIGALFGPSQVVARLGDFMFASRTSPLWVARVAILAMAVAFSLMAILGISPLVAAVFAIMFGAANGVMTIVRGALPLHLFGPAGYGRVIGRIARPALILQALAPFAVASAIEGLSDSVVLELGALGAIVALGCFIVVRSPQPVRQ